MSFKRGMALTMIAALLLPSLRAESPQGRQIISDPHFANGFILWQPKPGAHVPYGQLKGLDDSAKPIWGLSQWNSRFPLDPAGLAHGGALIYSNAAKTVILGAADSPAGDLTMAVNAGAEYIRSRRSAAEPWAHLLVEQEFDPPAFIEHLTAAKLHVEARLLRSRLLQNDYSPALHAAQFQIFFTVQNRNAKSAGYGDLLWFGVPIYDNRSRFPNAFTARDFGGTGKFIFTPDGKEFASESAHDGRWITIDKDLLPLMRAALNAAWSAGFLKDSRDWADYAIGGMNMGWELPGTFDVSMRVRNLSLIAQEIRP